MTEIAVVIVNYNTCDLLRACLQSVLAEDPQAVVVVDNASGDDSYDFIEAQFPTVHWLENETNLGYGAAANLAIDYCTTPYVLLLNSDTLLQRGALKRLAGYLDRHPQVAIAGPRLLNVDRTVQPSYFPFPTPAAIFLDVSRALSLIHSIPWLNACNLRSLNPGRSSQVPWVVGAALAIRRRAFEAIGGFNESFFMYYEEVDLCYRLAQAGWQVHYEPSAEIIHVGSASTQQQRADMTIQFYASLAQFYRRHYSLWRFVLMAMLVNLIASASLIRDSIIIATTRDIQLRKRLAVNLTAWQRLINGEWLR